jgi:hypothetical protein
MKIFFNNILVFIFTCIILSGCANPRLLLRKNQEELELKPNQGGVLFSLHIHGHRSFWPQGVVVREINQYETYQQNKVDIIPLSGYGGKLYRGMYLFNMRLPRGTYQLSHFTGMLGGVFGQKSILPCNKVFDVYPQEIAYIGRVNERLYVNNRKINYDIKIEDYYKSDLEKFRQYYPILNQIDIKKDLIY